MMYTPQNQARDSMQAWQCMIMLLRKLRFSPCLSQSSTRKETFQKGNLPKDGNLNDACPKDGKFLILT